MIKREKTDKTSPNKEDIYLKQEVGENWLRLFAKKEL